MTDSKVRKLIRKRFMILWGVVAVLLCALIVVSVFFGRKSSAYRAVNAQLHQNQASLSSAESSVSSVGSELSSAQKQNSDLQSQLAAAQNEQKRLQEENASLQKQMETLAAKKRAAAAAAAANQPVPAGGKTCYLTFDDGPSANTLKIIDILNRYGIKATFFVIGAGKTDYLRNLHDSGQTIGLHTATHNYAACYASVDAYFSDLQSISDTVERVTGVKSQIVRFPGGSSNSVSAKYCRGIMTQLVAALPQRGYAYFDWNVSSGDAEAGRVSSAKIRSNVLNGASGKNLVCVLMHDAAAKTTTVDALPGVIEGLRSMGFSFGTLAPDTYGFHHSRLNN